VAVAGSGWFQVAEHGDCSTRLACYCCNRCRNHAHWRMQNKRSYLGISATNQLAYTMHKVGHLRLDARVIKSAHHLIICSPSNLQPANNLVLVSRKGRLPRLLNSPLKFAGELSSKMAGFHNYRLLRWRERLKRGPRPLSPAPSSSSRNPKAQESSGTSSADQDLNMPKFTRLTTIEKPPDSHLFKQAPFPSPYLFNLHAPNCPHAWRMCTPPSSLLEP